MAILGKETSANMLADLKARLRDRLTTDASLYKALNDALRVISQVGSYSFLQKHDAVAMTGNTGIDKINYGAHGITDIDLGKKVDAVVDYQPLSRVSYGVLTELEPTFMGNVYPSHFAIDETNIYSRVAITTPSIDIIYQKLWVEMAAASVNDLPANWCNLVVDVAEFEQKRKFRTVDVSMARQVALERMKLFVREFAVDADEINVNDIFATEG